MGAYLRRLSSTAARHGAADGGDVALSPFVRSRSPLAEHDQRLGLVETEAGPPPLPGIAPAEPPLVEHELEPPPPQPGSPHTREQLGRADVVSPQAAANAPRIQASPGLGLVPTPAAPMIEAPVGRGDVGARDVAPQETSLGRAERRTPEPQRPLSGAREPAEVPTPLAVTLAPTSARDVRDTRESVAERRSSARDLELSPSRHDTPTYGPSRANREEDPRPALSAHHRPQEARTPTAPQVPLRPRPADTGEPRATPKELQAFRPYLRSLRDQRPIDEPPLVPGVPPRLRPTARPSSRELELQSVAIARPRPRPSPLPAPHELAERQRVTGSASPTSRAAPRPAPEPKRREAVPPDAAPRRRTTPSLEDISVIGPLARHFTDHHRLLRLRYR